PIQETRSTFHPRAQRNAFRRGDARQQSKSFAPSESTAENPAQTPSGLAEFVGNQLPIFHESISQIFMCFSFLMHTRNRRFAFRKAPQLFRAPYHLRSLRVERRGLESNNRVTFHDLQD